MTTVIWQNDAFTQIVPKNDWRSVNSYRIHLLITEEDGIFSAVALNLPGAGSCGDTEEEAIENAREAIAGVLEEYAASGEAIPWRDRYVTPIPREAKLKWILVNG